MPKNVICDGSVAIAFPKNGTKINKKTLEYYSTDEFREFYRIARNKSTRSMNIDSNSIFFFGKVN
jgi:DNA (cytosine-5)-methyltransferase 1